MSEAELPDVGGREPVAGGPDGLEETGQGAGRLIGEGAEQAIAGDDAEQADEADPPGAAASLERQGAEHVDAD